MTIRAKTISKNQEHQYRGSKNHRSSNSLITQDLRMTQSPSKSIPRTFLPSASSLSSARLTLFTGFLLGSVKDKVTFLALPSSSASIRPRVFASNCLAFLLIEYSTKPGKMDKFLMRIRFFNQYVIQCTVHIYM